MKDSDEVMTAEEVSGLLKVSLVTVRRWTASGYLPHMHLGLRMVRYRRDMIEKWMQNGCYIRFMVRSCAPALALVCRRWEGGRGTS